jgi:hypothetical protein
VAQQGGARQGHRRFGLIIGLLEALGLTLNLELADTESRTVNLDTILEDYDL